MANWKLTIDSIDLGGTIDYFGYLENFFDKMQHTLSRCQIVVRKSLSKTNS